MYLFNKSSWHTYQVPHSGIGEAQMRQVGTISILVELRVFGEILCPRLREKKLILFAKM